MKRKTLKVLSASLALSITAGLLYGCGGKADVKAQSNKELGYISEFTEIDEDLNNIYTSVYSNGKMYFINESYDNSLRPDMDEAVPEETASADTEAQDESQQDEAGIEPEPFEEQDDPYMEFYNSREMSLISINIDGTDFKKLPEYQWPKAEPDVEGDVNVTALAASDDGTIYELDTHNIYPDMNDIPEDGMFESETDYILRKLDENGAETAVYNLSEAITDKESSDPNEYSYIQGMAIDGDNNIYVLESGSESAVYVFDSEFNLITSLTSDGYLQGLCKMADGRVFAVEYLEDGGLSAQLIDPKADDSRGETISLPMNAANFVSGDEKYPFYFYDSSNLYGYDLSKNEGVKLLNWIACDVDFISLIGIMPLEDGKVFAFSQSSVNGSQEEDFYPKSEIVIFRPRTAQEAENSVTLKLSTLFIPWDIRTNILEFNKTNGKYRIEVTDYQEYVDNDGYDDAITKMKTEIMSGNVPDMIVSDGTISMDPFIRKGLVEDLYPYLDKDEALSRDDLVSDMLKSAEVDGKLYYAFSAARIDTMAGLTEVVGHKMGWTMDEMKAALATLPEGARPFADIYLTRDEVLIQSMRFNASAFIDWSTGKCSFDNPYFLEILEIAKDYPEEIDWDNMIVPSYNESQSDPMLEGKALITSSHLGDFTMLPWDRAPFGDKEITYVGYPSSNGSGSILFPNSAICMTSKCSDKEGAWEFIRTLFEYDEDANDNTFGFPINQKAMDAQIKEAMEMEPSSGGMAIAGGSPTEVEILPLTQEEVDMILELISISEFGGVYDDSVMEIVSEEAKAYFNDEKPASEVVSNIQKRVQLYVNEQG